MVHVSSRLTIYLHPPTVNWMPYLTYVIRIPGPIQDFSSRRGARQEVGERDSGLKKLLGRHALNLRAMDHWNEETATALDYGRCSFCGAQRSGFQRRSIIYV